MWTNSPLPEIPADLLERAISIMASSPEIDDDTVDQLYSITQDEMLTRRLIAWIPEAFGHVYLGRIGLDPIPNTFSARDARGRPVEISTDAEPLYRQISQMAAGKPSDEIEELARGSSCFAAFAALISDGGSIADAVLSGPALISIRSDTYGKKSFFSRLMGR